LQIYSDLLPAGGLIEFKTDNMDLFDFSIEEIEAFPDFDLIKITRDLHHDDDMNPGNVMTEYEAKFSALGNPIYKLIAKRR
jgi:tRNA (guanine-N7-)-methyltransferase